MPRGSPFTALCQLAATLGRSVVADLHTHTVASDGDYTASQIVALARQARLDAVAITDHDTVAGVALAQAAAGSALRVVPGVECSAEFEGRELHILGYFLDVTDPDLLAFLSDVQARRRDRFFTAIERLNQSGATLEPDRVAALADHTPSLGRRHLATLLLSAGIVQTRSEAFARFLRGLDPPIPAIHLTPAAEVIQRIHSAGGLASLAHPPREFTPEQFAKLSALGLDAVEAHCPSTAGHRSRELVKWAGQLKLGITGGTDTHGPPPPGHPTPRTLGSVGLGATDWATLLTARPASFPARETVRLG